MYNIAYYTAPWCRPCQTFKPIARSVIGTYDELSMTEVNIDELPTQEWQGLGIYSVPTLILRKDGEELIRIVGTHSADRLRDQIDEGLKDVR
jgi:thioredoxin 1